jgi:hypothetical protein
VVTIHKGSNSAGTEDAEGDGRKPLHIGSVGLGRGLVTERDEGMVTLRGDHVALLREGVGGETLLGRGFIDARI